MRSFSAITRYHKLIVVVVWLDFYQNLNLPQAYQNQSVLVVLLEVGQCVEAVVGVEASPELHRGVEQPLGIEGEGPLGVEEEEEASAEGVEGVIPILQSLALVAEDDRPPRLALRPKYTQNEVRSFQHHQLNM